jgi:hypothetical protein
MENQFCWGCIIDDTLISLIFDEVLGYLKSISVSFAIATIVNLINEIKRGIWDDLMTPLGR